MIRQVHDAAWAAALAISERMKDQPDARALQRVAYEAVRTTIEQFNEREERQGRRLRPSDN